MDALRNPCSYPTSGCPGDKKVLLEPPSLDSRDVLRISHSLHSLDGLASGFPRIPTVGCREAYSVQQLQNGMTNSLPLVTHGNLGKLSDTLGAARGTRSRAPLGGRQADGLEHSMDQN